MTIQFPLAAARVVPIQNALKIAASVLALAAAIAVVTPVQAAPTGSFHATVTKAERTKAVDKLVSILDPDGPGAPKHKGPRTLVIDTADHGRGGYAPVAGGLEIDLRHALRFDLFFLAGSTRISQDGRFILGVLADALKSRDLADFTYLIGGHTDAGGDRDANRALSKARAAAVRDMLVHDFGVAPWRLEVFGFGEERLLKPNDPKSADNRKIEIALVAHRTRRPHREGPQIANRADGDDDRGAYAAVVKPPVRIVVRQRVRPDRHEVRTARADTGDVRLADIWHTEPTLAPAHDSQHLR